MFHRRIAAVVLAVLAVTTHLAAAEAPQTEEEKALYALGMMISLNLAPFQLSEEEVATVKQGMTDSLLGRDTHDIDPAQYQGKLQAMAQSRASAAADAEKEASVSFLAAEAARPGAETTESGLIYTVLEEGEGKSPSATDRVTVHYHGTLRDGTVFDSSVARGEPATFGLNQVIPCWTEGVAKMKVGGKARLVCPADIAYGDRAAGKIPPGAALSFEVELLEIEGE